MSVGAVNKNTGERIPTAGMPAIDSVLSGSSTNPVQNRVVKAALDEKVDAVSGKGLSTNDYSNTDKAKVDASLNVFTGTQAEWAALSTAEKKTYQRADFTDDYDNTAIGDLTALHTSAKSSIVNAINEVADGKQNSTDNNLQTTSKTIVGGINEVKSGLTGKLNFSAYAMDGSATVNIYHYSMVIVMSDRGGLYFDGSSNRGLQALVPSEAVTLTHVDGTNLTVKNNSQYGTNIIVLSDNDITISPVS